MTRLRFDAEAHHRLEAGGKVLLGGQEDEFSKAVADALLADPNVPVSVVKPPAVTEGATKEEVKSK